MNYTIPVADPRVGSSGRVPLLKDLKSGAIGYDPFDVLRESQSMYTMGGGSVGGQIWDRSGGISESAQAASRARGKKGVRVLPTGAGSKQEMRYLKEEAEREGYDWVEAPKKYVRGTGQPLGDRKSVV